MELFEYGSLAHYVFEQKMTKKFGKQTEKFSVICIHCAHFFLLCFKQVRRMKRDGCCSKRF